MFLGLSAVFSLLGALFLFQGLTALGAQFLAAALIALWGHTARSWCK